MIPLLRAEEVDWPSLVAFELSLRQSRSLSEDDLVSATAETSMVHL